MGNPNAHNLSALTYGPVWLRALGSRNVYTATTVDQMPKHISAGLMFGAALSIPVPDVDRTDHLMILGANPLVSNGSLLTAPDMRGRLRRIRERGGKVVVIDPRRTRTAEAADEHHFIRPGGDAHLLMGMVHTLFAEGLVDTGAAGPHINGVEEVERAAREHPPEAVAEACGIDAEEIRRLARELAAADSAAVYGRIGTCTQEFGALASWLVDVLNALTGNLDREGGAMFTRAAAGQRNSSGQPGSGRGFAFGRWKSRVRGLSEALGELPVSCLAEEIDTPGEGQVRALITAAGNPLVSTPNAARLERAVEGLDFMLSLDIYVNETTRHADVILPGPGPLEKPHYDLALYQLAARNVANFSPAVLPPNGVPQEWETLARLAGIVSGQGPKADVDGVDEMVIGALVAREVGEEHSRIAGRDQAEILAELEPRRGPERILDLLLRTGPYGDAFGDDPDGLTLARLEESPHGIDLGPLTPRLPEVLRTASGKVELAPAELVADVPRLAEARERRDGDLVLVGRRQLRSNNSWMHNLSPLVKGKDRCTAHVHPSDAERLGLADGGHGAPALQRGRDRGARGGHRRGDARRGERAPRLGPRRARHAHERRGRPRRREQQRAGGRDRGGPAVGQRRAQRDSDRGVGGGLRGPPGSSVAGRRSSDLERPEHRCAAVVAGHVGGVGHARDRHVRSAVGALRAQLEAVQAVHAAVAAGQVRAPQPGLAARRALGPEVDLRLVRHCRSPRSGARAGRRRAGIGLAACRLNVDAAPAPPRAVPSSSRPPAARSSPCDTSGSGATARGAHAQPLVGRQLHIGADVRRQGAHQPGQVHGGQRGVQPAVLGGHLLRVDRARRRAAGFGSGIASSASTSSSPARAARRAARVAVVVLGEDRLRAGQVHRPRVQLRHRPHDRHARSRGRRPGSRARSGPRRASGAAATGAR